MTSARQRSGSLPLFLPGFPLLLLIGGEDPPSCAHQLKLVSTLVQLWREMKEQQISSSSSDRSRIYRKRCMRCFGKGSRKMDAPDLTILYAKDGLEWERYLDHCFRQLIPQGTNDRPLHIHSDSLEHLSFPLSSHKVAFQRRSKAQLVILTPEFLDFVQTHPGTLVGQLLEPKRVVAMLCGVESNDVEATHRAELVSFPAWRLITVKDQDKDFVLELFHKTVEVMELSEGGITTYKPQFKLAQRKVREGYGKVFAMLQNPIAQDHDVKVYVKGNKGLSKDVASKMRNPYTVQFVIPDYMMQISQIVTIQIFCDGISLGSRQLKCENQMGELNQLLKNVNNPMEFLSQTLGLSGCRIKDLDNLLVKNFRKNVPSTGFDLLDCSYENPTRKSEEEMPTLLHFAAFYGLKELCSCLLDSPNAKIACSIRNNGNATPAELADNSGHKDLAQMLENFTNLTATAELYSLGLCSTNNTTHNKIYDVLYDYPTNIPLYDIPRTVSELGEMDGNETYLPMTCSNPSLISLLEPHKRLILGLDDDDTSSALSDTKTDIFNLSCDDIPDTKEENARFQGYNPSQVELLEILEDFKKNKYSINEVEQLFEDWKIRQNNSFKEKENQLKDLRSKYEQIQQSAPEKGKKSLSLDRIISLLTKSNKRNNSKSKSVIQVHKRKESDYEESKLRPTSTLSNASLISNTSIVSTSSLRSSCSSSSSERLSTASSSTYDSGAQSDSGDDVLRRKNRISATIKERISQFELSSNPPPVPSVLIKERNSQTSDEKINEIIDRSITLTESECTSPDYVSPDPEFVYQSPPTIIKKVDEIWISPKNTNLLPRPSQLSIEPIYNNITSNEYYNYIPSQGKSLLKISKTDEKQQKILDPYPHKQPLGLVATHVDDGTTNDKQPPPVPPRPPVKGNFNDIYSYPRPPFSGRPLPSIPK